MKTLIASLAAIAAVTAIAAPAAAQQPYGHDQGRYEQARPDQNGRDWNGRGRDDDRLSINQRQQNLEQRIQRGIRTGEISRREAYGLQNQSRQIARLEARYRVNGLSQWERVDLDRRFDRLEAQIRAERHDRDYGRR